jgi:hypothetical protein
MCSVLLLQTWMVFLWEIPVFLQLSQVGLFGIKWAFLTLKTVNCRNYSSQAPIQLSKGNIVLDARTSTMHTFLLENSPNGPNAAYLPLQTPKILEEFLSKTNTVLTGKHVPLTWMVFLWQIHVFLQLSCVGLFEMRWASYFQYWHLQGALLSKTKWILIGKHCARCGSF